MWTTPYNSPKPSGRIDKLVMKFILFMVGLFRYNKYYQYKYIWHTSSISLNVIKYILNSPSIIKSVLLISQFF